MKIAYFNCMAGASGDMILGALLDAGLDFEHLKAELGKLPFSGYNLAITKTVKKGISATKFDVEIPHEHHHRGLNTIFNIIDDSTLDANIKEKSKSIFQRLGEAEAKIHNKSVNEIHFHEVGAVDAIVDIVGAVIGFETLGIDKIVASPLHVGSGTVKCAHGVLPVPAPATAELLKKCPIYSTGIQGELVTPTGAAILSTLATFGDMPGMILKNNGYGAGGLDLDISNVLRVMIGESEENLQQDTVQIIQTNIDDMNPQFYEHIMETLFKHGAWDVYLTPVIMKKNRPGTILNVLAKPTDIPALSEIILKETTTLGVRITEMQKRKTLKRETITIKTEWGDARAKIRLLPNGEKSVSPEYEDCKKLAREKNVPIQKVYQTIKSDAESHIAN